MLRIFLFVSSKISSLIEDKINKADAKAEKDAAALLAPPPEKLC